MLILNENTIQKKVITLQIRMHENKKCAKPCALELSSLTEAFLWIFFIASIPSGRSCAKQMYIFVKPSTKWSKQYVVRWYQIWDTAYKIYRTFCLVMCRSTQVDLFTRGKFSVLIIFINCSCRMFDVSMQYFTSGLQQMHYFTQSL